jgi:hypothetical protein
MDDEQYYSKAWGFNLKEKGLVCDYVWTGDGWQVNNRIIRGLLTIKA